MSSQRVTTPAEAPVRTVVGSRKSRGWSVPVAWSLLTIIVVLRVVTIALNVSNSVPDPGGLFVELAFLVFPVVGALIALSRPENPIGWLFLVGSLGPSVHSFAEQYATYALLTRPQALPGGTAMAWLTLWIGNIGFGLITLTMLLFPTGRLPSRRWWPVFVLMATLLAIQNMLLAVTPGPIADVGGVRNPLGREDAARSIQRISNVVGPLYGFTVAAAALSLILRFLRAQGEERQQIKWVAYAMMLLIGFIGGIFVAPPLPQVVMDSAFVVVVTAFPISVGIAILRYRLWDIDFIIRRTLAYSVLTAALALVYVSSVTILQTLTQTLTGRVSQSSLTVVISTLAIAALFQPLRRRIHAAIDRRFYRRRYDTAKTLAAFGARLRDEVDLNQLTGNLIGVVEETLQPTSVSVWLRPPAAKAKRQERTIAEKVAG